MTDLTLQGKITDLNHYKTDILANSIEESRLSFEYTIYGKGEMSNPKEFSHENLTQREDRIYN